MLPQMLLQGGGLDPRDLSPEGRGTRAQRPLPQGTKGSDMTDGKVLGWLPRPGVLTQAPGAERGLEQRQQVTSAAPLVGVQLSQPKQSTEQGWGGLGVVGRPRSGSSHFWSLPGAQPHRPSW